MKFIKISHEGKQRQKDWGEKTKFMKRKKERKEKNIIQKKNRSNWEKKRKKWEIEEEEKEKIRNMLRRLSSISWMAQTGTAGVECVKDASTSLLDRKSVV